MRGSESRGRKTEHGLPTMLRVAMRGQGGLRTRLYSVIRHLFTGPKQNQSAVEQGLAISLLILGVVLRLVPHPPNFAPISAIALFGGANLARPYAIILPLLAMFASDMIGDALGLFPGFHRTMPAVYLSFILVGLIGLWVRTHRTIVTIVGGAFAASIIFFLITNFAVWLGGTLYPQTWEGLLASYIAGVPFFKNTLLGDLFFTGALFGVHALANQWASRRPAFARF